MKVSATMLVLAALAFFVAPQYGTMLSNDQRVRLAGGQAFVNCSTIATQGEACNICQEAGAQSNWCLNQHSTILCQDFTGTPCVACGTSSPFCGGNMKVYPNTNCAGATYTTAACTRSYTSASTTTCTPSGVICTGGS